jgi:transcriptional regulator with XRE-family HTH domain
MKARIQPLIRQLAQERRAAGLKLGDVADRAGYSESYFEKLEAGHRNPLLPTLNAWAEVLGWELVLKKRSET